MAAVNHPRSVVTGVSVLYTSLILGFISGIINVIHVGLGMPSLNVTDTPPYYSAGDMIGIVLGATAIGWFVISRINAGKNWARYLYLALMIAGVVLWSVYFDRALSQGIFTIVGSAINTFLGFVGMVCLFSPASNDWFKHGCRGNSCD